MLSIVGEKMTVEKVMEHIVNLGFECDLGKNLNDAIWQYNLMIEDGIRPTLSFSKEENEKAKMVDVAFSKATGNKGYYDLGTEVTVLSIEYSILDMSPTFEPTFEDIPF